MSSPIQVARCQTCGLEMAATMSAKASPHFGWCPHCKGFQPWVWTTENGTDPTAYGLVPGQKDRRPSLPYWLRLRQYAKS